MIGDRSVPEESSIHSDKEDEMKFGLESSQVDEPILIVENE